MVVDVEHRKWPIIYLAKLRACQHQHADFTDAKKDTDLKDDKKECLIELIDVLDESEAANCLHTVQIMEATIQMISANLFRTFANKSKTLSYSEILENKKTSALE